MGELIGDCKTRKKEEINALVYILVYSLLVYKLMLIICFVIFPRHAKRKIHQRSAGANTGKEYHFYFFFFTYTVL